MANFFSISLFLFIFVIISIQFGNSFLPRAFPQTTSEKIANIFSNSKEQLIVKRAALADDDDSYSDNSQGMCVAWWTSSREIYRPSRITPTSTFCEMYNSRSCCSYDDTIRVHSEFINQILYPPDYAKFPAYGPRCFEAIESFFCYPCAPNFGNFFYIDYRQYKAIWKICQSTCEFLFNNCKDEPRFNMKTDMELCNYLEQQIENITYFVDVQQIDDNDGEDDSRCFHAIPYTPHHHGPSGCAITWIVFVILGCLACCSFTLGIGVYITWRKYKERREMSVLSDNENAMQTDLYKM